MYEVEHVERDETRMDAVDRKLVDILDEIEAEVIELGEADVKLILAAEAKEEEPVLEMEEDIEEKETPLPKPAAIHEEQGDDIQRTTHNIGVTVQNKGTALGIEGLVNGGNGNGAAKKKEKLWKEITHKETLVPLPDGALSVEADQVAKEDRIYVYEWPTMIYIGYDVKGASDDYEDYLVMFYRPDMKVAFGNKLAIDVPSQSRSMQI